MVQSYIKIMSQWHDFKGRCRRDQFWEAFICNVFIVILLVMFSYRIGGVMPYIQMAYQIITTIPFLAAAVRRLHDVGKSAWILALAVIPFIGWVIIAYMLCTASIPDENRYGENPYEPNYYHL